MLENFHKDNIWLRIMRDKYLKNNNFFRIKNRDVDSIVWKEIINHRIYMRVGPKLCIKMIEIFFDRTIRCI